MSTLKEQITSYLVNEFDLDLSDAEGLFAIAQDSVQKNLKELELFLASGDSAGLSKAAHTLKGALLNVGQKEQADLAKIIELQAKQGNLDGLEDVFIQLKEKLAGFFK
ncbi:Hpt domain-containing protein [Desulfohalobiaceae bacterium Ax17]|uniref:Hpt domain-containing protein n=1 Tax=Desulfovulcanus ferrireducens TaxID=2831190 RepID=UPI00207BA215|nr:Hpt domain-containing protein [Desulfovulcanus ferrireducens]MBT8764450.1 Hpt domain-containing protein [Desulfovulcanus ferrireducens]